MLPVSPEAHRPTGWTRQTRTESLLLMELFPPLYLQSEQSFSCGLAYSSDRRLGLRVCWIFDYNFRATHSSLSRVRTSWYPSAAMASRVSSKLRRLLHARWISTTLRSLLSNTYLPVAVLPPLFALPKNCKRKH